MRVTSEGSRLNGLQALAPALVVGALPLVVLPGAFAPFHAGKWFAVLLIVPAGLAACAYKGTLRWPLRNWFIAWIAVNAVAAIFGVAPWVSLAGSPNRNAGLLAVFLGVGSFVLGASTGSDSRAQRLILRSAFLAGGVVGVLAVLERAGLDLFGLGDVDGLTRARSTWGSATFAGSHLVMVLPIAVAHLRSRDLLWKRLAAAATVAMTVGLVLTGTRGAWLGALVGAAVMVPAWLGTGDRPAFGRTTLRRFGMVSAVGIALVAAVMLMLPNLGRSSGVGRIDQLRTALPVIADRPLLGSGPDTQRVVLPSGIDESFERKHGSEELHDRVHNIAFDTLVTTGVVGLLTLGALVLGIFRAVAPKLRRRLVPTAVAAGLVGYLVTLLFAFGDPTIDPIAWLLAGLLVVGAAEPEAPSVVVHLPGVRPPAYLGVVAFALVAAGGAVWAGGEVVAEYRLDAGMESADSGDLSAAAEHVVSAASIAPARFDLDQIAARFGVNSITAGEPLKGGQVDGVDATAKWAQGRLDRAQRVVGDDPGLLMDRAELLTAWQRPDESVELYGRIAEVYPNSFRAQLGLGLAQADLRHFELAEKAWRRAADLGPEDARALVNLGLLHENAGDPDGALAAFTDALKRDPEAPGAAAGIARVTEPSGG